MSRRVLLIDYDPRSTTRIRGLLADRGIEVEVRGDGVTAARDFERVRPAVVLVQDLLPKKHGFEVCRELKGSMLGHYVPVLLITGIRAGREWELRQTECDGFVRKPFADEVLVSTVERFLPEPASPTVEAEPSPPRPEIPVEFSEEELTERLDALIDLAGPPVADPAPVARRKRRSTTPRKRKRSARKSRQRGSRTVRAVSA